MIIGVNPVLPLLAANYPKGSSGPFEVVLLVMFLILGLCAVIYMISDLGE